MKRVLDCVWKPTLTMVLLSTLPYVFIGGWGGGSRIWIARIAVSAAITTALAWWVLVARRARPGSGSGGAAGALGGFAAYFFPLIQFGIEVRKRSATSGLGGLLSIYGNSFRMAPYFVIVAVLALMGMLLIYGVRLVERRVMRWRMGHSA